MAEGGSASGAGFDEPESVIINGVIDGVKQSFVDSGVDLEVLNKLQELWMTKLKASSSQGLSIADVMSAPGPAPVRRKGKGKGKGKNRVTVPEEIPAVQELVEDEVADFEDKFQPPVTDAVDNNDVIVISSDENDEGEQKPRVSHSNDYRLLLCSSKFVFIKINCRSQNSN